MRRLITLAVLLLVVVSCGEGAFSVDTSTTTAPSATSTSTTEGVASPDPTGEGPQVAAVDCSTLLTLELVDESLGIWDRPPDEMNTVGHRQGEYCIERIDGHEDVFVGIEPGKSGDFAAGAELIGVTGQPVSGVGDEALWFGEVGGVEGVLSVHQSTSLGELHFRIALGRPELDSAAQQEIAKTLALAILPRFPWVEVEQPETEWVISEPDPVDLSDVSYVNNLLVKEEEGEWTRGEGLVATLGLFAGETDQTQVLRHSELLDYSGTGVIQLAEEYLEHGTDTEAKMEIARLLERLVLTAEQLEEITEDEATASETSTPHVSMGAFVLAQSEQGFCANSYNTDIHPCMVWERSQELEGKWSGRYVLSRPKSEVATDWTLEHIGAARRAMEDSANKYEALVGERGMQERVVIVLTGYRTFPSTYVSVGDKFCVVYVHRSSQNLNTSAFQQVIARDLAYCLIGKAFSPSENMWWRPGLATYLSGVVDHGVNDRPKMLQYSKVNLEHWNLPRWLAAVELTTPLLSRDETNWVFFEFLHSIMAKGEEVTGVFGLIGGLPGSLSTFAEQWHPFNEQLTDAQIPDVGGGTVPYTPNKTRVEITGSGEASFAAPSFGITRLHVEVTGGEVACVEYANEGPVKTSWRPGAPGPPGGDWSEVLPDTLTSESVFLVTASPSGEPGLQPEGILTIKVKKVVDDPKDCEDDEEDEEDDGHLDESPDPLPPCDPDLKCDGTEFLEKKVGQ